jgi:spore coat polysaccharide biosynthesis protein SpsF (cytidylyltransferase family)
MKSVIMIQARTTSTRLPGKVLGDLAGRPMLAQQLRRVKRCAAADEIVVLTTTNSVDEPIVALAGEATYLLKTEVRPSRRLRAAWCGGRRRPMVSRQRA